MIGGTHPAKFLRICKNNQINRIHGIICMFFPDSALGELLFYRIFHKRTLFRRKTLFHGTTFFHRSPFFHGKTFFPSLKGHRLICKIRAIGKDQNLPRLQRFRCILQPVVFLQRHQRQPGPACVIIGLALRLKQIIHLVSPESHIGIIQFFLQNNPILCRNLPRLLFQGFSVHCSVTDEIQLEAPAEA